MDLFIRENILIRSAHPPQYNNIDFIHLGNNNAQTIYPIFENSYLIYYLIKSYILNGLKKSDTSSTWRLYIIRDWDFLETNMSNVATATLMNT